MRKKPVHIDISSISNPTFLKTMSYDDLNLLCEDIRKDIIQETSLYGGHLSSNLGVVELTVALHRVFDFPKDKLIFDVGHQCYTHKILTGRSLAHLNEKGCISGFQKINESEYDCYEAGHSSTSLSAAEGFALARDSKGEKHDVIAVIGDSSIANGLAFEALNNIGNRHEKVIIVLNDNDMSISSPVGGLGRFFRRISSAKSYNRFKVFYKKSLSKTKVGQAFYDWTFSVKNRIRSFLVPANVFEDIGFTYIGPIDGHNIKAVEKALVRAKHTTKPVIVHVKTIKGKGYTYAEKDQIGYWHGVTPFEVDSGAPKDLHPGQISWSHYMSDLTFEIMKDDPTAWLIVPATLKGSGLEKCFASYENRCLDVGIAEEHSATLSGSLALNGFHPILVIYSTFLQRAYDEISHDCARLHISMTILVDRAGLVGKNGDTHQGIYDVAYLKSIPGLVITMPSTQEQAKALYKQSLDNHGVFAIRYPRDFVFDGRDVPLCTLEFGKWRVVQASDKEDDAVIAVGPNSVILWDLLKKSSVQATEIDPIYLNPVDDETIVSLLGYKNIWIYDSYGTAEGFSQSVEARLLENGYIGAIHVKAVPNSFIDHASIEQQESQFGLLPEQVAAAIAASHPSQTAVGAGVSKTS